MRLIDADALHELIDGGFDLDFENTPEVKKELLRMIDEQETIHILFICNGERCERCSLECRHTTDIKYAANFEQLTDEVYKERTDVIPNAYKRGYVQGRFDAECDEAYRLVSCKHCRKWTNGDDTNGTCSWNEYQTLQTRFDDFCSYGERKEEV